MASASTQVNDQQCGASCVLLPGAREGRDPARAIKRGPSNRTPESVAATQRERLYDGLVHTVAAKGYEGARITDICRAAAITRPVFYELFHGKEDAFLATYRHGTGVLLSLMRQSYRKALDTAPEPGERWPLGVSRGLATLLDVLAQVPVFATMALVEIDAAGPRARAERAALLRRFREFFAEAPVPPPPGDPAQLRSAVIGGVYTTLHAHVASGRTAELPAQRRSLAYAVLAPYLGPQAAAAHLLAEPEQ